MRFFIILPILLSLSAAAGADTGVTQYGAWFASVRGGTGVILSPSLSPDDINSRNFDFTNRETSGIWMGVRCKDQSSARNAMQVGVLYEREPMMRSVVVLRYGLNGLRAFESIVAAVDGNFILVPDGKKKEFLRAMGKNPYIFVKIDASEKPISSEVHYFSNIGFKDAILATCPPVPG